MTHRTGNGRFVSAIAAVTIFTAFAITVAARPVASAETGNPIKIGYLSAASVERDRVLLSAFRKGLQKLGYAVGIDLVIERRFAGGRYQRLPKLAEELLELDVKVILAQGAAARAAKAVSAAVPVVFIQSDPVGTGLIDSLANTGENITGLSSYHASMTAKRLELLKTMVPSANRVAVLYYPRASSTHKRQFADFEKAASSLGVSPVAIAIKGAGDFDRAFSDIGKAKPDALVVFGASLFRTRRTKIIEFAAENRIPAIYTELRWTNSGGLMSYGTSFPDLYRRSAYYVDRILKGSKPASLPVEQPTTFELAINLQTARALGIAVPRSLLLVADEIVD